MTAWLLWNSNDKDNGSTLDARCLIHGRRWRGPTTRRVALAGYLLTMPGSEKFSGRLRMSGDGGDLCEETRGWRCMLGVVRFPRAVGLPTKSYVRCHLTFPVWPAQPCRVVSGPASIHPAIHPSPTTTNTASTYSVLYVHRADSGWHCAHACMQAFGPGVGGTDCAQAKAQAQTHGLHTQPTVTLAVCTYAPITWGHGMVRCGMVRPLRGCFPGHSLGSMFPGCCWDSRINE